jgi:hypothetical protein
MIAAIIIYGRPLTFHKRTTLDIFGANVSADLILTLTKRLSLATHNSVPMDIRNYDATSGAKRIGYTNLG